MLCYLGGKERVFDHCKADMEYDVYAEDPASSAVSLPSWQSLPVGSNTAISHRDNGVEVNR
jgi:hypothetical protein